MSLFIKELKRDPLRTSMVKRSGGSRDPGFDLGAWTLLTGRGGGRT